MAISEISKMWYSRFVAMNECDYQIVLGLLGKASEENPEDKDIARTLAVFKRNQEEHYSSREEYYARKEAERKTK